MKDSNGHFVPLGKEFSVLTDTSDEEEDDDDDEDDRAGRRDRGDYDDGDGDRGGRGKRGGGTGGKKRKSGGKYGIRDESTQRLLGKVPDNVIPRTVAMPVQMPSGGDDQRSGKRSGKTSKPSNGVKKKVRIVV